MSTLTSLKRLYNRMTGKHSKASTNSEAIKDLEAATDSTVPIVQYLEFGEEERPNSYGPGTHMDDVVLGEFDPRAKMIVATVPEEEGTLANPMCFVSCGVWEDPSDPNENEYWFTSYRNDARILLGIMHLWKKVDDEYIPDGWEWFIYDEGPDVKSHNVNIAKSSLGTQWFNAARYASIGPSYLTDPATRKRYVCYGMNNNDLPYYAHIGLTDDRQNVEITIVEPNGTYASNKCTITTKTIPLT